MTIEDAFEQIYNDPVLFERYTNNPIVLVAFLALKGYVSQGNKIEDLPWFNLCKQ